jgi:hypothetical protein
MQLMLIGREGDRLAVTADRGPADDLVHAAVLRRQLDDGGGVE